MIEQLDLLTGWIFVNISDDMNIVIPMAGSGSRFKDAGFNEPKPFINVKGKPLVQWALEGLGLEGDVYMYYSDRLVTHGAVESILKLQNIINTEKPLFIVNCDQYVKWDRNKFFEEMVDCHGGVLTFKETDSKYSFAQINEHGYITMMAEKKPISDHATVGIYYWKHGCDFVSSAYDMMRDDFRVNGEYYTAPVYNWGIKRGLRFKIFDVDEMYGLGTPEDVKNFTEK